MAPSRAQVWMYNQFSRVMPVKKIEYGLERARKFVLRIQDMPPSKDGRRVLLDPSRKKALIDERTNRAFIGNTIRSSKYNAWNFVPRQLFAQFSKLANFYFLCVSILQMIPGLSTTGNYTTIVPLLFFISISIGKEGYEDLRRHKLDKEENNREAHVLHAYQPVASSTEGDVEAASPAGGPLHWAPVKWQKLQVGDVVRLRRDDAAPADLILLNSLGPNGIAYVETMALDGETNLKPKQPSGVTRQECRDAESVAKCHAEFRVEDPNLDLYNFEGRVNINGQISPLTNNEIIYRGSILRNTPEAYGLVIYTGEECKIRMNANKNPRIKAPSLQFIVNKIVFFIVIFVVLLALFCTVAYQIWHRTEEVRAWYFTRNGNVPVGHIITGFIIMFNTMIPLSLYVSMEIIKICQMILLNDVDMYDEVTNTPFEARTSTINEELGQVSYVFSDKTGTLTENIMRFRKLSVAGFAWLHDTDLKAALPMQEDLPRRRSTVDKGKRPLRKGSRKGSTFHSPAASIAPLTTGKASVSHEEYEMESVPRVSISQWQSSARPAKPQTEMTTSEMIAYVQRHPHTVFSKKTRMLILAMALCHTCLPERSGNGDELSYQASSPDELALVQAAVELGFLAWDREVATLILKLYPNGPNAEAKFETYEVLDVIEFSSKRKRMSVIMKFPDGRICVLCKGADSVIMERLKLQRLASQKAAEIERRASQRKSMEANEVLRRKSSQIERRSSVISNAGGSISLARNGSISTGMIGKLAPIRDEVDGWLHEREHDVEAESVSPRTSFHYHDHEPATPTKRGSWHGGFDDEEHFVDEAIAVDDNAIFERCFQHINDFASEGLRTLLFAHRFLDNDEYNSWKKIYHDATTSLVDRQILIEKAGELIEQQLELTGATAIEDKLQHGVPETIDRLRRANVKLWMLTGDKRETAINIGHSCRLIKDYSTVTVLDAEVGGLAENIVGASYAIDQGSIAHSVIVVDGATLATIEADGALFDLFMGLAILADSVICCRASPSQKASLVHGIRKEVLGSVTLAIGDGANDIAMIQEAHVGIGITGKEGLQAARTSDYAIAQFRFLTKLLLVHGRWNYIRTCKYTVGTFWKEMLFYLIQAFYQKWNGYTGTSLFEPWSLSMFNTLFTSLPVIFLGIFEKDLMASTLIAVPELYTKGQLSLGFNFRVYFSWMFLAAAEAAIIYFCAFSLYEILPFTQDQSLFAMGDLCFTASVIFIVIKLQVLEIHNHSITAAIAMFLSIGGWFLWNMILSATYAQNHVYFVRGGFISRFGSNVTWWAVLALAVIACISLEIAVRSIKAAFVPTDVEVFQALEKEPGVSERFEEASALWLAPGWEYDPSKASELALRVSEEAQAKREGEIQDLLNKPRVMSRMEEGSMFRKGSHKPTVETEVQSVMVADGFRQSTEIHDMLGRRFGSVKSDAQPQEHVQ